MLRRILLSRAARQDAEVGSYAQSMHARGALPAARLADVASHEIAESGEVERLGEGLDAGGVQGIDAELARVSLPQGVPVAGLAGTVTSLAAVELGLEPYDAARIQGLRMTRSMVERQLARYLELPHSARRRMRGLEPKRAETIPAGAAIMARVMARAASDELVVSDRGIRWGLAWEISRG